MAPFDPTHVGAFLISLDNQRLLLLRIAFSGLKYAIGATGFTMISSLNVLLPRENQG